MNEEEIKLLNKIEELPKELNIEIRGLILAEICLRKENQQLKEQLQQKEDIINKARKYISKHTQHDENGYVVECLYVEEAKELLEILDNKGE